jgi:uncharacterized membrane protein YccC
MSVVSNTVADRFALGLRSLTRALPAVYYGTRIAAAVSIALYAAFLLQLDQPQWAALTAIIVAQPVLGAALRKGVFRLIGTVAGAAAAILLVILFPQSRTGFFLGLALWGALCGYAATALCNFAAYGGVIAGFTSLQESESVWLASLTGERGWPGRGFITRIPSVREMCAIYVARQGRR